MWIYARNGFLSIVQVNGRPEKLLVRSRFPGDIEACLGADLDVEETPTADYRYRAIVDREEVKKRVAKLVEQIDYTNFKAAAEETMPVRSRLLYEVWDLTRSDSENPHQPTLFDLPPPPADFDVKECETCEGTGTIECGCDRGCFACREYEDLDPGLIPCRNCEGSRCEPCTDCGALYQPLSKRYRCFECESIDRIEALEASR